MAVHDVGRDAADAAAAASRETGKLLDVRGLEVIYGGRSLALRGVSLSVPPRGAVAVLGANGAGKTTTIRAVSGLLYMHDGRVREGDVTLDGRSVLRLRPHEIVARGVAQVPEGRMVFGHLTVEENLRIGASQRRDGDAGPALDQVLELFPPIAERRRDEAGWMSGGEQQMVAIGRALMASPRLLLLDEVSLGLAPKVVTTIFERLQTVREELGTAMLMVEQNAKLALDFCEHAFIIESGRVVLDGPSGSVRNNEKVQELYLGGSREGSRRSFADAKRYRSRRRWL
jgi:branched-chain amino acid transport system ATP-binding protein